VSPYDPTDGGGAQIVTRSRIQSLHRLGCEVVLVRDASGELKGQPPPDISKVVKRPPGGVPWLTRLTWTVRRLVTTGSLPRWNAKTWNALADEVFRRSPALVLLDGARAADYGALLRVNGYRGRIVLNEHNVEHHLLERQRLRESGFFKRLELAVRVWRLRAVESHLARYVDACVALTDVDRSRLLSLNAGLECVTAPPAVDFEHYRPQAPSGDGPEVLFIGSCHWAPNLDGLTWFAREIWPSIRAAVPDARLNVVGRGPPDWLSEIPGAVAIGYVEDERPFYDRARVVVVPLRFGSGVRIKILNAFAMSRPVVSTSLGAEGIPAVPGKSIEISDDVAGFAHRTIQLLQDRLRATAVGAEGQALARGLCSAESVDGRILKAIGTSMAPSPALPAD
jgi:glycosyltransferase involved in cell wall biosynthesis